MSRRQRGERRHGVGGEREGADAGEGLAAVQNGVVGMIGHWFESFF